MDDIKLWRVYRSDINKLPGWSFEYMVKECYVLAKTWERAKGIAKDRYPSMFDDIAKKEVLVELVDMSNERGLMAN